MNIYDKIPNSDLLKAVDALIEAWTNRPNREWWSGYAELIDKICEARAYRPVQVITSEELRNLMGNPKNEELWNYYREIVAPIFDHFGLQVLP